MPPTIPAPMSLLAELTYRCPLQCPYCSNPIALGRYRDELATDDWVRALEQAAELGVIHVHFSGGEPLLRDDLERLLACARERDMYTNLSTSGVPVTQARLASLRSAGLDHLQVSLLDSDVAQNDQMGGAASFAKKEAAVSMARALGFPVTLNVVLTRMNLDRIEEILELAQAWGVERLELAHTQYIGWAFKNREALLPTLGQLERTKAAVERFRERVGNRIQILHVLPDYFQKYPKACLGGWGRTMLAITPRGDVTPCQTAMEIPGLEFPNIRDQSLGDIWHQSEVFNKFRGTDWMPEPCATCDRRELDFGGCRCQAFLITGDAGATDPVCHLSPDRSAIDEVLEWSGAIEGPISYDDLEYRRMSRGE